MAQVVLDTCVSCVMAERTLHAREGCAGFRRKQARNTMLDRRVRGATARALRSEKDGSHEEVKEGASPEKMDELPSNGGGVRWDGANLRWVKDPRVKKNVDAKAKPLSGPEYTVWPVVHTTLVQNKLQSVECDKADAMMRDGKAVMLDIRTRKAFEKGHVEGAISVPLFRPVEGRTKFDNLKRLAMAGFAMEATERDPDFVQKVLDKGIQKGDQLIVCCDIGGTLETIVRRPGRDREFADKDRAFGRESRSLKACFELQQAGFTNVLHLKDGYNMWLHLGYPVQF